MEAQSTPPDPPSAFATSGLLPSNMRRMPAMTSTTPERPASTATIATPIGRCTLLQP